MIQKVVNPYTFVPFLREPARKDLSEYYPKNSDLLTGWLDVRLITKTALIIPDGANIQGGKEEHKAFRFFRENGVETVPGSELRGMLRSEYEAVSNSCLPFLMDDKQKSMRVPLYAALKKRGLLELKNGVWSLYSTSQTYEKISPFETERGTYKDHKCGDWVDGRGYIQFSTPVNKKDYSVHYLNKDELLYTFTDDSPYKILENELCVLSQKGYNVNKNPSNNGLWSNVKSVRDRGEGCVPVWYLPFTEGDETKYLLSPSAIGRVDQKKHWSDIMGPYNPCKSKESVCPACALFGSVNGDAVIRGRLRFSSARPENGKLKNSTRSVILPILGEPKPTAYEFYIKQPDDAVFWNYDVYSKIGAMGPEYYTYTDFAPRGRKFYWHGKEQEYSIKDKMNATAETVGRNEVFDFRIFFDDITQKQLDELCWLITLGENNADSRLMHKLGHARPVGYGSVKLLIRKQTVRNITCGEHGISYSFTETDGAAKYENPFDIKTSAVKSFIRVTDADATAGQYVYYPSARRKTEEPQIFTWFAGNRNHSNGDGLVVLPPAYPDPSLMSDLPNWVKKTEGEVVQYKAPERKAASTATGTVMRVMKGFCIVRIGKSEERVDLNGINVRPNQSLKLQVSEKNGRKTYSIVK